MSAVGEVIITFLLIVVAAVIIQIIITYVKIYELNQQNPPPPSPTNTVSIYYFSSITETYTSTVSQGEIAPTYDVTTQPGRYLVDPFFEFQYGVDMNTNPFCATLNQTLPVDLYGYVDYNSFTPTNEAFTLNIPGPGGGTLSVYSVTNTENGVGGTNDSFALGGEGTVTDLDGDSMTWTQTPVTTNYVVILRSTNLISWTAISTNAVYPGWVNYFSDTNIFMPTMVTYYNFNTNGFGGGDLPPGVTNNSSTNGVMFIPGQAFYQVVYPSNQNDYITTNFGNNEE